MNFWIFLCCSLFQLTVCTEDVIKDETFRSWWRNIYTLYGTGETFKPKDDGYRTCTNGKEFEAWLLTHTLNINQTLYDVKLYIEVESQMEPCENVNGNCFKDAFELFRYNGEGTPVVPYEPGKVSREELEAENKKAREFFQSNFTYIGNITGNSTSKEIMNTTFTLNLKQFRTITFGIKTRGSCGSVIRMKVYYIVCKETFINSVMFRKTLAPQNGTKVVFGNCSANAKVDLSVGNLTAFCRSNGSWSTEGGIVCTCKEGYESTDKRGCSACQSGWYKSSVSNTKCTKCPTNTVSAKDNTNCECKDGYYRLPSQATTPQPCYAPIKIPDKPKVNKIEDSRDSVNITWLPPVNNSMNETTLYEIQCNLCDKDAGNKTCSGLSYNPSKKKTYVRVSGLINEKCYQFRIVTNNSQNRLVPPDKWEFVSSNPYIFQSRGQSYIFRVCPKNSLNAMTPKKDWKFLATERFTYQQQSTYADAGDAEASNTANRIIIILAIVIAGLFLSIVLIVMFVKLNLKIRPPRLSTPVDIPLERTETSPESLQLPVYQEPDYEVARVLQNVDTNTETSYQDAILIMNFITYNAGYEVSANDEEHYETISQYEAYEEPNLSPQNPGYAELDKSQRRNSENDDYQKLQWPDSDYVIPANERQESCEDIEMEGQHTELDQSKRETEESQRSTYVIPQTAPSP